MQLNIARWGNSLALRLPTHIAKETRLEEGATVNIEVKNGNVVLTPVRKRFKLDDLLAGMEPAKRAAEFDWGNPEGDETW